MRAVNEFHRIYYESRVWLDTTWRGVPIAKCPLDLHVYQEILWERKPMFVVETGTWHGGSALWFRDMMQGGGYVITIDTHKPERHDDGVTYLVGSSTDPGIFRQVAERVKGKPTMVVLDSNHSKHHVLKELDLYAPLVTPGQYLIVEDTNVNGNPVAAEHGPGPGEALDDWLPNHPQFVRDLTREKFLLTFNPGGFLQRMR